MASRPAASQFTIRTHLPHETTPTVTCPHCGMNARVVDFHSSVDALGVLYKIYYWCYGHCNQTGSILTRICPAFARPYTHLLWGEFSPEQERAKTP